MTNKKEAAVYVKQAGFTLLEMLIVLSIVGLVTLVGAPSYKESIDRQQLKGAIKSTYFLLKTARMMTVNHNKNISVQFNTADNWCIALSDTDSCDCQKPNSCTVGNQMYGLKRKDFPEVSMQNLRMGKLNTIEFDRHRGISVGKGGSGEFTISNVAAKFIVSNLGRVRICMTKQKISGYPVC